MRKIYGILTLLFVCLLTACGSQVQSTETHISDEEPVLGMLEEPVFEYEIPVVYPGINVDLIGYEPDARKIAVLSGKQLPYTYQVKDYKSGAIVFTGDVTIEEVETSDDLLTGYADFTELETEGKYYIESDILGSSKPFEIKDGIYDKLLSDALKEINGRRCQNFGTTKCHSDILAMEEDPTITRDVSGGWHTSWSKQKDVVEGCLTALDLMLAYEYHPDVFDDALGIDESGNKIPDILDEIRYETDWLMKMQNAQTGGVFTSVLAHEDPNGGDTTFYIGGETTKATAYFCTTLARFSYIINRFDSEYANQCLKAAGKAWQCMELNSELMVEEQRYRAAVEMYRATGYNAYGSAINKYLESNAEKEYESRITLDAAITYLSTPKWVDRNYCTLLMQNLMSRTEAKSDASKKARYLVVSEDIDDSVLLRNAVELVVVDYIISNQEYAIIEENYLHYFLGRNAESSIRSEMTESPDMYAQFIVLMSKITDDK